MVLFLTLIHTAISLIGIATGVVAVRDLVGGRLRPGLTQWFLMTTVATSGTGFLFPVTRILPSHVVGAMSLVILAAVIAARSHYRLRGRWRPVYVVGAVAAVYLNVFVLIVQLFLKVPILHTLAPTQAELPFAAAQLLNLVVFLGVGTLAVRRFRPAVGPAGRSPGVAAQL